MGCTSSNAVDAGIRSIPHSNDEMSSSFDVSVKRNESGTAASTPSTVQEPTADVPVSTVSYVIGTPTLAGADRGAGFLERTEEDVGKNTSNGKLMHTGNGVPVGEENTTNWTRT
jgi:hypothetical protein